MHVNSLDDKSGGKMKKRILVLVVSLFIFAISTSSPRAEYQSPFDNTSSTPQQWGPSELKDVKLQWLPSEPISALDPIDISVFKNKKIMVEMITDTRKNQFEIGKNIEKKWNDSDLLITTKDNVARWITERFSQVLFDFDLSVVKSNPDIIIQGDIIRFYVTEKSTYKTNVALNIKIKSNSGKILWEGMISGKSNKFGASYKENNYHEGLSNAIIDVAYSMLKNDQIRQALK